MLVLCQKLHISSYDQHIFSLIGPTSETTVPHCHLPLKMDVLEPSLLTRNQGRGHDEFGEWTPLHQMPPRGHKSAKPMRNYRVYPMTEYAHLSASSTVLDSFQNAPNSTDLIVIFQNFSNANAPIVYPILGRDFPYSTPPPPRYKTRLCTQQFDSATEEIFVLYI